MTRFEQVKEKVREDCLRLFGREVNLTTAECATYFPEFKPTTIRARVSDGSFPRAGNSGRKPRFTYLEIATYAVRIGRHKV